VASAWLLLVGGNLLLGGHGDVAVRDVVMAVSAFTLTRLLELRAKAPTTSVAAGVRQVTA
jgi:hypothetical protein